MLNKIENKKISAIIACYNDGESIPIKIFSTSGINFEGTLNLLVNFSTKLRSLQMRSIVNCVSKLRDNMS